MMVVVTYQTLRFFWKRLPKAMIRSGTEISSKNSIHDAATRQLQLSKPIIIAITPVAPFIAANG